MNKKQIVLSILIILIIAVFVALLKLATNENQTWAILTFYGIPALFSVLALICKIEKEQEKKFQPRR